MGKSAGRIDEAGASFAPLDVLLSPAAAASALSRLSVTILKNNECLEMMNKSVAHIDRISTKTARVHNKTVKACPFKSLIPGQT